jgi:AcrR family transcriptional regulator
MGDLVQRRKAMAEEMMRGAICDAASAVLAQVGFAALTMDRVAEAAGVSKGTLYNYYLDKDALMVAVIDRAFAAVATAMDDALARQDTHRRKLAEAVRLVLTGVEERRALGRAICSSELPPRLDADLRAKKLRVRQRFVGILHGAKEAGELAVEGRSPEELGRFLRMLLDGIIDERMVHGDECPPVEQDVALIEDVVLRRWFRETAP